MENAPNTSEIKESVLKTASSFHELHNSIIDNPDISVGDLRELTKEVLTTNEEDEDISHAAVKEKIDKFIFIYGTRRRMLRSLKEGFDNPNDLFKEVFDFEPTGLAGVEHGPITIHFKVTPHDFQRIISGTTKEQEVVGLDTPDTAGFVVPYPANTSLQQRWAMSADHAFSVGSYYHELMSELYFDTPDTIRKHEEMHSLVAMIRRVDKPERSGELTDGPLVTPLLGISSEISEIQNIPEAERFEEYIKTINRFKTRMVWTLDERTKDEILAYSMYGAKDWKKIESIFSGDKSSAYDYEAQLNGVGFYERVSEVIYNSASDNGIEPSQIENLLERLSDETDGLSSEKIEARVIQAVESLRKLAETLETQGMGRLEAAILLARYPLRKWPKVVETFYN